MASELGTAYVTIMPSMQGMSNAITGQLSKVNMTAHTNNWASSITKNVAGAFGTVGSVGIKAMAGVGTALGALTAKGGISRALNIDQAQMKFRALGMDVESVMASCNTAVQGTAYSLDSAATVASMLGASGVAAGEGMTRSLQAVAGAAAMGGVEYDRVGRIFSKVAAQGRLQGDELLQLSEAGVNATSALANHLGVTQGEVSKLVSSGKVDFQTFSDAMYEAFGDKAYLANETFKGALDNTKAALYRLGETASTPILDSLKGTFNALMPAINAVNAQLKPLVETMTSKMTPVFETINSKITEFGNALKDGSTSITDIAGKLATLAGGFTALAGIGTFAVKFDGLEKIGSLGSTIASGMTTARTAMSSGVTALGGAFSKLSGAVASNLPMLYSTMSSIGGGISSALAPVSSTVSSLLDTKIGGVFKAFFSPAKFLSFLGIGAIAGALLAGLGALNASMGGQLQVMIQGFFAQLPALMVQIQTWITTQLPTLMQQGVALLGSIIQGITMALPSILATAGTLIQTLVQGISTALPTLIPMALNLIMTFVNFIVSNFGTILSTGMQLLASFVEGIANALPDLVAMIPQLIMNFVTGIINNLPQILASGIQILTSLIEGLIRSIPALVNSIGDIMGKAIEAIKNTDWLAVGKNIIDGIAEGIKNFASNIFGALQDVVGGAIDGIKSFLGIHSPSRLMRDLIGENMALGIAEGITASGVVIADSLINTNKEAINKAEDELDGFSLNGTTSLQTVQSLSRNMSPTGYQRLGADIQSNQSAGDIAEKLERLITDLPALLKQYGTQTIELDRRTLGRTINQLQGAY